MENQKAYTVEEMEEIFNEKYVQEFDAFDKRFTEQIVSGVIEDIDALKKTILAKAFRGELGTNIESEESSIELLKSILQEV